MKGLIEEKNLKTGSICCGMGGFDYGLHKAGFKTVWALDIMSEACESFKANFPETNVLCQDAHYIKDFNMFGKVDGLVFGPPCQGFSRANAKRSMEDKRNYVYKATLRAVSQTNAKFFIFENVVGILDMKFDDGSSVFEKIKNDYENCGIGYNVAYKVIDCATVGIPQLNRLRLIMVGFRRDLCHNYNFPELTHGAGKLPFVTLKDTIWHLKDVDQTGLYYDEDYDWKYLSRNRQKKWDEPSYTIEASGRYAKLHPGFGKMKWISKDKWYISNECRRMSILEEKLIQTFPENYIILGSLEKQYEQIGNAVPPLLATFIGKPIYNFFKNISHQEKEFYWLTAKILKNPHNEFYKSLINWIKDGKVLTLKQKKYIA